MKSQRLTDLALLIVAVLLAATTLFTAIIQLADRVPLSPWEPAVAMEAMRLNAGLPVYTNGHATHMYGPLVTPLFAGVFRIAGLNLSAARLTMSIFALALVTLVGAILSGVGRRRYLFFIVALFLGINFRTNLVFFSIQPDCVAALFGVVGLYLWATRGGSTVRLIAALAAFVIATLFKQTAAAFALVPIAETFRRPFRFGDLFIAVVPTISIVLVLGCVRAIAPQMFAAIVTVPASIKIYPERAWRIGLYLLLTFPIFLIALWSVWKNRRTLVDIEKWALAAVVVFFPVGLWTMCKAGSDSNSLLFVYLAMTALFSTQFSRLIDWISSLSVSRATIAFTGLLAAICFSFAFQAGKISALLTARSGDDNYDTIVNVTRNLDGVVASPQDPTIAFRAKNYFGGSLFLELDTHALGGNWPDEVPDSLMRELNTARYVVAVRSFVPTPMFRRSLATNGFVEMPVPELQGSAYSIWTKR